MRTRAVLSLSIVFLGCASRPPDEEELGHVEQAVTCASQTLVASKTYKPSVSYADGSVTLTQAHGYVLPSTVAVTAGNSANKSITLTFSAGCGASVTCTWIGGSTQSHPTSKTELTKASKYNFGSCTNGAKSGGTIVADKLLLHVVDGDTNVTTVAVKMALAEASPCGPRSAPACDAGTDAKSDVAADSLADTATDVGADTCACNDNNPCTTDTCTAGVCSHAPTAAGSACGSPLDACSGKRSCDGAGACVSGPPPSVDDSNPCTVDGCDPVTGPTHSPVAVGTPCTPVSGSSSACNAPSSCDASAICVVGAPLPVDDGNPCTADSCDPSTGVKHVPVAAGTACGGTLCGGLSTCSSSAVCVPGAPPTIDDKNPCTADACDPVKGVTHLAVADGTSCADSDVCNGVEQCTGGTCTAGTSVVIDDHNPCTIDSCDSTAGVTHAPLATCDVPGATTFVAMAGGRPAPREGAGAVWDPDQQTFVLFGGANGAVALADTWVWSANGAWRPLVTGGPSPRAGAVFVRDAARKKIVLFGGTDAAGSFFSDTWEFDGTSWGRRATTGPSARAFASAAYDVDRGKVVVFGGGNGTADFSDVWEWDGSAWRALTTGASPSARRSGSMVYDTVGRRMRLFGGAPNHAAPLDDTWSLEPATGIWTQIDTTVRPPARLAHAMAFDATRGRAILAQGVGAGSDFDDVWELDPAAATWSARGQAPFARADLASAWTGTELLTFAGVRHSSTGINTPLSDELWAYSPGSASWTPRGPGLAPAVTELAAYDTARKLVVARSEDARVTWELASSGNWKAYDGFAGQADYGALVASATPLGNGALVFDDRRNRTVLITGGHAPSQLEWDGSHWTNRLPCTGAPDGIFAAGIAWDSTRGRAIAVGGMDASTAALRKVYEIDPAACSWSDVTAVSSPSARVGAQAIFDSTRARTIVFGGTSAFGSALADTWEWDGTVWAQKATASAPPARSGAAFVYDPIRKRGVLFGGAATSGVLSNDTWELDPLAGTWTAISSPSSPSARRDSAAFWDPERKVVVVLGGRTADTRRLGDRWEWDGAQWTRRASAASMGARTGASGGLAPHAKLAVLFGGVRGDGERAFLEDTWILRDGELSLVGSPSPGASPPTWGVSGGPTVGADVRSPSARAGHAFALGYAQSAAAGYGLLFGGEDDSGLLGDTWTFDDTSLHWSEVVPRYAGSTPPSRVEHALTTLPSTGYLLFGGKGATGPLADTWTFAAASGWTQLAIAGPTARAGHALATDRLRNKIVLFGGRDASGKAVRETWEFDVATAAWAKMSPSLSPPALFGHRMAWDPVTGHTILLGGVGDAPSTLSGDVWEWDGAKWIKRVPAMPLSPRVGHVLFADPMGDGLVVLGGHSYSNNGFAAATYGDLVRMVEGNDVAPPLYSNGDACSTDATCGSGHCVDGVCCATSCTSQCGACDVPGHEGTCTAVTGSPHGGRTSCGPASACGAQCNGVDATACHVKPVGEACAPAGCSGGDVVGASTCDATGACVPSSTTSCAPYGCNPSTGACRSGTCSKSSDCYSSDYYCGGTYPYTRCSGYSKITRVTVSPTAPKAGAPMTLTAWVTNAGDARFSYPGSDGNPVYPCGMAFSASDACTFTPATAGTYSFLVESRMYNSDKPFDDQQTVLVTVGTP